MQEISKIYDFIDKKIKISTGKIVTLAQSSVLLNLGGTTLLAVLTVDKEDSDLDFFPLSVEYIEKMYARGVISTSPFKKREGLPSDDAIIKARQVDHSIRSLFPKGFKKQVSIVLTVLSYDQINDPEPLALLGSSLCAMLANIPFYGPASGIVVCVDQNKDIILNPSAEGREEYLSEFFISGTDSKILNIEGWAKEIEESMMFSILEKSLLQIQEVNQIQKDFYRLVKGVDFFIPKNEEINLPVDKELIEYIDKNYRNQIEDIVFSEEKFDRDLSTKVLVSEIKSNFENILNEQQKSIITENSSPELLNEINQTTLYSASESDISKAVDYVARKILRDSILYHEKRRLGRGLLQIRPMYAEIDTIPYVHGSALFSRGLTQSLSIVTLGSLNNGLLIESMEGEETKRFMHHYNMPMYTTGEAGRFSYHPGRREIGHGAIGENALKNMIPSENEFPYTIRIVSEILTSNGSTSMAATCSSSMALMAAGIPMKEPVAGISVGLVTEDNNESNYKLLLDIEGIEDFYGDMDFKVAGTKNGITSIQYENKLKGVSIDILKEAFLIARDGRLQVLEVMNKVISNSRKNLPENAPVVESLQIDQDDIGALIGPGGKNIKELISKSTDFAKNKVDISIEDTGKVLVTAFNKAQMDYVKNYISTNFAGAELGKIYEGVIASVTNYGVFVDVSTKITGLCHISEISNKRLSSLELQKMFKVGQKVKVKVIKIDGEGRINFSMKGLN